LSGCTPSGEQIERPASYSSCDLIQVVGTLLQRTAHLVGALRAIINPRHSRLISADVVEDGLDNVRLNTKLGHFSRASSTQVVQTPISNACSLV